MGLERQLLAVLCASLTGCSAYLPFDELSGGTPKQEPGCSWQLSTETRFPTQGRPYAVGTGDFDEDGALDVVAVLNDHFADVDYSGIEVLLGKGERTFESWYSSAKNSAPGGTMVTRGLATGDVNRDGHVDAVQSFASYDYVDGSVDLKLGIGDGRLDWQGIWTVPKPDDIELGDFDGDGWLDAAVIARTDDGGYADEKLYLLWGDGQGSFELQVEYQPSTPFTNTIREITTADFDGDGLSDLALSSWGWEKVHVLRGSSDRGFYEMPEVPVGSAPWGLAPADFDGDGKLDLAVVNNGDFNVSILFGAGDGSFGIQTPITVGKNLQPIVAADLDSDGDADLAVGGQGQIFVLLNDGTGVFAEPAEHAFDGTASRFTSADVDGNGLPDIVLSNLSRDSFSVFWSECSPE